MRHLIYLAVLAACVVGTLPLEVWLRTRVYARPARWLLAIAGPAAIFLLWDWYAISHRQWSYDPRQTTGVLLPGRIPLEEALFFVVVPTCAILAFEAVRAVGGWPAGDEPTPTVGDGAPAPTPPGAAGPPPATPAATPPGPPARTPPVGDGAPAATPPGGVGPR